MHLLSLLNHFRMLTKIMLVTLIALVLSSCTGIGNTVAKQVAPRVNVNSVTIGEVSGTSAEVMVGMNVYNPNSVAIPLRGLDYTFAVNGQQIASGQQNSSLNIAANSGRDIQLPIRINFLEVASVIPQMMSSRGFQYQLDGHMQFPFIRLPYNRTGGLQF